MRKVFLRVSRWWCFCLRLSTKEVRLRSAAQLHDEGQAFVKFARQNLNTSKFALLYQNDDAGKEGAQGVQEGVKKYGGSLVYSSSFPGTETDFTSYLTRIKNSGAEVIFLYAPANTSAGANAVKTAKSLGLTQKIILPYSYAELLPWLAMLLRACT